MNRTPLGYRVAALAVVAAFSCAWQQAATAAEKKAESASPPPATFETAPVVPEEPRYIKTYSVRHADPNTVVVVLNEMLGETTPRRAGVGSEPSVKFLMARNNLLIVSGTREMHQKVEDLLKKLDVPPEEKESQIKVFSLVYADPVSTAKMLAQILPKVDAHIAVDEQTRSIVMSGSPDTLRIAEALVQRLDEGQTVERTRPSGSYEVRIVWLAGGLPGENRGEPLAADLKDVAAELARLGMKDPRQIGQFTVLTAHAFTAKGTPRFGDDAADFSASGNVLQQQSGLLALEISIKARQGASPKQEKSLGDLTTRVVVPEKQYVVLATAPIGDVMSAFVVQVTGVAAAGGKK